MFFPDGASSHVMVDELTSTEHLCRLMMKKRNVPLMTSWSVLEQLPELFIGTTPFIVIHSSFAVNVNDCAADTTYTNRWFSGRKILKAKR